MEKKKLTELELEKLNLLKQKEQENNELKLVLGDLTIQIEIVRDRLKQGVLEFSQELREFQTALKEKYGEVTIEEDGTIRDKDI